MVEESLKIILAQPRGFCAGVVRAIEIVERAVELNDSPVYVRHEIVHNRHVVQDLKAKGARFVAELDEIPDGAVTVFSAHGVSRTVEANARARGLEVLDATCPLVRKVHKEGARYIAKGRTLVLIGHAGHPEVEGTIGQIDGTVHLVQSVADVASLPIPVDAPVAYITQTTLSIDDTRAIIEALAARFADLAGPDTRDICYATQNRQTAVRRLAPMVDLLLVVGARNSSNSNRLRELGEELGVHSRLIADAAELDAAWLEGVRTIGLTAGASAPEVLVQGVIARIKQLRHAEISVLDGIEENVHFDLPPQLQAARKAAADAPST
ncbi:MAG: 4-hydroxy-3-methylbut-2-enyl diphosphate reductase [Methylobacterium sp.]|nr:MAG: 4-hydroxy-3-methylbut-2-enyl diphosphate reductase [Methylobacterium sp.]